MTLSEYAEKFKTWVLKYGTTPVAAESHRLTPVEDPSGTKQLESYELPTSLSDIPDHENDESNASIWATIFCGSGNVKKRTIPDAQRLHEAKLGPDGKARLAQFGMSLDTPSQDKASLEHRHYEMPPVPDEPNKRLEDKQQEELLQRILG
jgi:hypothetical protein